MSWSDESGEGVSGEGAGTTKKRLAAVISVEAGDSDAVYSFSGVLHYSVGRDDSTVTVLDYSGDATHVSGPQLGVIGYRMVEPVTAELRDDRTFVATGRVAWSDASSAMRTVAVTLRGTVLDNDKVAFLTSTFATGDAADPHDLRVQIPACW